MSAAFFFVHYQRHYNDRYYWEFSVVFCSSISFITEVLIPASPSTGVVFPQLSGSIACLYLPLQDNLYYSSILPQHCSRGCASIQIVKYVITITFKRKQGGTYPTEERRRSSNRTWVIWLNSVDSQPGSVFCVPCVLHRPPELITSECTPWNDGWAFATGLSGEGAGPYGSGIWKLIAEDRAKGGE